MSNNKKWHQTRVGEAVTFAAALPFVVGTGVLVGLALPALVVGEKMFRKFRPVVHTLNVLEDWGDTVYVSCTCGARFYSDAYGENCFWDQKNQRNITCCPFDPRMKEQ